jgi:hypothetical protein
MAFSTLAYSWGKRIFDASITGDVTAEALSVVVGFKMAWRAGAGIVGLNESREALGAGVSINGAYFTVVGDAFITRPVVEPISVIACFAFSLVVRAHGASGLRGVAW